MPFNDPDKQREFQRKRVARIRQEHFKGKECEWCGSTIKLVTHHINRANKVSHKVWSWTPVKRNKELEKCIIICQECHLDYHGRLPLIHGTINAYGEKKCRCTRCKAVKSAQSREYYIRKMIETCL